MPSSQEFDYSSAAYVAALADFVEAVGIQKPFHLIVQVPCSRYDGAASCYKIRLGVL